MDLQIGDIVKIKGISSPRMVVINVYEPEGTRTVTVIDCLWFKKKESITSRFNASILHKVR